jgi:hypothetical protein
VVPDATLPIYFLMPPCSCTLSEYALLSILGVKTRERGVMVLLLRLSMQHLGLTTDWSEDKCSSPLLLLGLPTVDARVRSRDNTNST